MADETMLGQPGLLVTIRGAAEIVLVLRVDDQSPPSVTLEIEHLLAAVTLEDLAECVAVFRGGG